MTTSMTGMYASSGTVDLAVILAVIMTMTGVSGDLHCWHCIGNGCDNDPSLVESAMTRKCHSEESCQKVYYMGQYDGKTYESTVRSCSAGPCVERNDFDNCTRDIKENPGCMKRVCCNQSNKCNGAHRMGMQDNSYPVIFAMALSFMI